MSAIAMTGCTSMHRVSLAPAGPTPVAPKVGAGDKVRVTLEDGRRVEFTVDNVDAAAIIARDNTRTRYDLNDIRTLERQEFSGGKTSFLLGGIAAGTLCFLYMAAQAILWSGGGS
jgi:hypothetical protein